MLDTYGFEDDVPLPAVKIDDSEDETYNEGRASARRKKRTTRGK